MLLKEIDNHWMNIIVNRYTDCKIEHKFNRNKNKLHPKVFVKMLRH